MKQYADFSGSEVVEIGFSICSYKLYERSQTGFAPGIDDALLVQIKPYAVEQNFYELHLVPHVSEKLATTNDPRMKRANTRHLPL